VVIAGDAKSGKAALALTLLRIAYGSPVLVGGQQWSAARVEPTASSKMSKQGKS
jgi:hypothetical protein